MTRSERENTKDRTTPEIMLKAILEHEIGKLDVDIEQKRGAVADAVRMERLDWAFTKLDMEDLSVDDLKDDITHGIMLSYKPKTEYLCSLTTIDAIRDTYADILHWIKKVTSDEAHPFICNEWEALRDRIEREHGKLNDALNIGSDMSEYERRDTYEDILEWMTEYEKAHVTSEAESCRGSN